MLKYTETLEAAIAEAKAAGLEPAATELERACFGVAFTTSNEMLGEHGLAIQRFLKAVGKRLPEPTRAKLVACLMESGLPWPGWRGLLSLLWRR